MHDYWRAMRLFSPSLRRLLTTMALTTMVAFGLAAVLQNLYLLRLGYDARFIGLLYAFGQTVWAAAALPASMLSRRTGLRNAFMFGVALFGLGLALILLVEGRPTSLWSAWLMAGQGVMMLGAAFITVNIPPYLMAVTGETERRHAFSAFQAVIPTMAFIGSLMAGLLPGLFAAQLNLSMDDPAPYRLALWFAPCVMALAILPMFGADPARIIDTGRGPGGSGRAPYGLFAFLGIIVFFQAIGEGTVRTFFNVYLDTSLAVPTAQIGIVMGTAQLLPILAALSTPLLMQRWGTGYTLVAATLGIGLFLLPLAAVPQLWAASLAFMGIMGTITVISASRDLFGQEIVVVRWRTTAQAVAMIGLALGWAAAGAMGGYLIETVGFGAMFFIGAVSAGLSALLLIRLLRRRGERFR